MDRFANWIAPVLVGMLIGTLLSAAPVSAKRPGGPRALAREMAALEARVELVEAKATADAAAFEARLTELEQLTQLLDQDGSYVGYVDSVQVWSHYCTDGAEAVWSDFDGFSELSCPGASPSVARPARPKGLRPR